MCVIVSNLDGKTISKERLLACQKSYPHGIGLAVIHDGIVDVRRDFRDVSDLIKRFPSVLTGNQPYVLHFRLSTSGGISPLMRHPHPISDWHKLSRRVNFRTSRILFHNGVVGRGTINQSDTSQLAECLTDLPNLKIKNFLQFLSSDSNRFLLLDNGQIDYFGKWESLDGIKYSNLDWERKTAYRRDYGYAYHHHPNTAWKYKNDDDRFCYGYHRCFICGSTKLADRVDTQWVCSDCLDKLD